MIELELDTMTLYFYLFFVIKICFYVSIQYLSSQPDSTNERRVYTLSINVTNSYANGKWIFYYFNLVPKLGIFHFLCLRLLLLVVVERVKCGNNSYDQNNLF